METILYLTHTQADGSLSKGALEALSGAVQLARSLDGSALHIALIGEEVKSAADSIAGCGASRFLAVRGAEFDVSRYASDAAAAASLAQAAGATVIMAPSSSRLARALPGAAARTGGRIDTHVAGIAAGAEGIRIQRWYYRQRMAATLSRSHRPWWLLVDSGIFEPWSGDAGGASVEEIAVDLPESALRTKVLGTEAASAGPQTIRPDADLLFVAGAGWTKKQADGQTHVKEAEELIRGFLEASQASLGSSKSLVDQASEGQEVLSVLSHLNQVGQTGSTPRHPKGLAACCHGEEPHTVGWRFIHERRAINKDAGCGWAQGKADVLYVADAFEVVAKVIEMLKG